MSIDKPNYTQIPNTLLDDLMMLMDGAELKVTLAIARQTFGFHRERHSLSLSELQGLTGLSKQGVINGVDAGAKRGTIARSKGRRGGFVYELIINVTSQINGLVNGVDKSTSQKSGQVDDASEATSQINGLAPVNLLDSTSQKSGQELVNGVDSATPMLNKEKESIKETQKGEEEDTHVRDAIHQAWFDYYGEELPVNLDIPITGLAAETSEEAVIYGIRCSVDAKSRNFRYIAQCARNYIPVPPTNGQSAYHVDFPGIVPMPAAPLPAPVPEPPPMAHDDFWAVALVELLPSLPGVATSYLKGSTCADTGEEVDGRPLYRITVEERAEAGVGWLMAQAGPSIKFKLGTILGKRVQVEIVAAEKVIA